MSIVPSVEDRLAEVAERLERYRARGWRHEPADEATILRIARAEHAEELAANTPVARLAA